jgi:hypothetical protein
MFRTGGFRFFNGSEFRFRQGSVPMRFRAPLGIRDVRGNRESWPVSQRGRASMNQIFVAISLRIHASNLLDAPRENDTEHVKEYAAEPVATA